MLIDHRHKIDIGCIQCRIQRQFFVYILLFRLLKLLKHFLHIAGDDFFENFFFPTWKIMIQKLNRTSL